jgi:aryl-alcohol dehydrogenase-like predicted oxidoreductase
VIRHEAVASAVLGVRTVAQLNEQLGAFDVQLTPEEAAQLEWVSPRGGVIVPCYLDDGLADFQPHCYRW